MGRRPAGVAVDVVFDGADDLAAGGGALGGAQFVDAVERVLGDVAGEQDGAADGFVELLEGDGAGGQRGVLGGDFSSRTMDVPTSSRMARTRW